ncbi:TonB-dependent receptor domain-containing protein [Solemya velum gill symbiont]|uniref:TonB-dependent receptor domain-containing protein n=1 Tax=Solemya velum gill symbiont TaxID=2340 RepID=UPI002DDD5012|nr:TonB-dependent receptor [Solemya velum gill symbiont]
MVINVGLMYEEYDAGIMSEQFFGDSDYQDTDTETGIPSARIGLNYRINDNHAARLIVSRASRLPSDYEEFFGGNYYADRYDTEIPYQPFNHSSEIEKVDSIEIGYLGHFMNRKLSVDANLFYNDFETLSFEFDDILPERYAKLHSYSHAGLDLEFRYTGERNFVNLAYSYVDVLENDLLRLDLEGRMSAPEHTLSLLYSHQFGHGWKASASLFHVSDMRWTTDSASGGDVTWADLKLVKDFKTTKGEVHLALTAQNIFDEIGVTLRADRRNPAVHSDGERRFLATLRYSF